MSNSKLLQKSKENKDASVLLAQKSMYNAALSRVYYSVYQKVTHVINSLQINTKTNKQRGIEGGRHERSIAALAPHISSETERFKFTELGQIRQVRNDSEYKEHMVTNVEFQRMENIANELHNILDRLIIKKR